MYVKGRINTSIGQSPCRVTLSSVSTVVISFNCYLIVNFLDQQAEVHRSANRQSFPQRPAQQPPTNSKVMNTSSGPISAQISSMFGPSHSQPLLHSHGGGGSSSSGSSSNNRSMNDLPGMCIK